MTQPNILFLKVDQLFAAALNTYGNPFSITPHLDELFARGTTFENTYCSYPICAPSRFSTMTGQLASKVGAYDNAAEMAASIPTFAHYLRAAGYQTCLSGKMHFVGPDQLHGFEERLTAELYPTDFTWNKVGTDFAPEQVSDARGVTHAGITRDTVQIAHDELVAFRARRKIYDLAQSNDQRPFLLCVSFTHPHEPFLCRREDWDLYEGIDIPPPSVGRIPDNQLDPLSRRVGEMWSLLQDFDPTAVAIARRAYYGSVSFVDRLVGQVLTALKDCGFADNTAIVFTSDHGEMLGERGLWFKKVFYEPSVWVPLVICMPDSPTAQRVQSPVSLVDLAPTLIALANDGERAETVEPLEGESLLPMMRNKETCRQSDVVSELMSEGLADPVIMIRRGAFKFIGGPTHPSQLFDLESDPQELTDLAGHSDHAATLDDFTKRMHAKWDFDALKADLALSQKRRALIQQAHGRGVRPSWDTAMGTDEAGRWLRSSGDYGDWAFRELPGDSTD
ncbi:MAG: choline-sulfatase [Pseudomonadota bacterium]